MQNAPYLLKFNEHKQIQFYGSIQKYIKSKSYKDNSRLKTTILSVRQEEGHPIGEK
jgi:hypothetical protein